MNIITDDILDKKVYPILIKNSGKSYLTLYYYDFRSDSVLHTDSHLIYFSCYEELKAFCSRQALSVEQEPVTFDFDISIVRPTDYKVVLDNWNLLDTISHVLQMFFEGNEKRYNALYDLLFRYNFSTNKLPGQITHNKKINRLLLKVFKRKNRLLNRFIRFDPTD